MQQNKIAIGFLVIACILLSTACKVGYSFTGASLSPDVKTISVQNFPNYAPIVQPTLSRSFTERLKDKFVSQTSLTLVNKDGDLNFEGSVIGYATSSIGIQANEIAAQNRLTITLSVKFTNKKDEKQNFEQQFSKFANYNSSLTLSSVEADLIKQINEQLVDEIFIKAASNW